MSQDKLTKSKIKEVEFLNEESASPKNIVGTKKYVATPKHILPIHYKGSIIYIGETTPIEIDFDALGYEPKIQFLKALKQKQIIEVGE